MEIKLSMHSSAKGIFVLLIAIILILMFCVPVYAQDAYEVEYKLDSDGQPSFVPRNRIENNNTNANDDAVTRGPQSNVALLFGMSDYHPYGGEISSLDLIGTENDIIGMKDVLENKGFVAYDYLDKTKAEFFDLIDSTIANMASGGTLFFHYSGHGNSQGSLVSVDRELISVLELEARLDSYDGTKVVVIDSCHSGAFIDKDYNDGDSNSGLTAEEFNALWIQGLTNYSDGYTTNDLAKDDYYVLTAASKDQTAAEDAFYKPKSTFAKNNYTRTSYPRAEKGFWTGFINRSDYYYLGALSEAFHNGCGLYEKTPYSKLHADNHEVVGNLDGIVSLDEMYNYTYDRAYRYQDVQVYPENSNYIVFENYNNISDFEFADNGDGTATITRYIGKDVNVDIPNSIGGLTVTVIGEYAFDNCTKIKTISMGDSVVEIQFSSFSDCTKLESIRLSENLEYIGDFIFSNCKKLRQVDIPASVNRINNLAFYNSTSLTSINVSGLNTHFKSVDGVLFDISGETLCCFPIAKSIDNYVVPDGVTTVRDFAFCQQSKIEKVEFPDTLTQIGYGAFALSTLSDLYINQGINSIDFDAFAYCTKLDAVEVNENNLSFMDINGVLCSNDGTKLLCYPAGKNQTYYQIPNGITTIGRSAFSSNPKLASIVIADSVEVVGIQAFIDCRSLKEITIPNSVTTIDIGAFSVCRSLKEVTIPDSVTFLGDSAFFACFTLKEVNLGNGINEINRGTFSNTAIKEIKIPHGVETIYDDAFAFCGRLRTIEIPDSVTNIGSDVFFKCKNYTLNCYDSSYVHTYAVDNSIDFEIVVSPIGDVEFVEQSEPIVYETDIRLQANAAPLAGREDEFNPEYRFLYKAKGATRWSYVSNKFSTQNEILFKPKNEGEYYFKVEAKNQGRSTIDKTDETQQETEIFHIAVPVQSVNIEPDDGQHYCMIGEEVDYEIIAEDNGEAEGNEMEYRILFSTNGKSFKPADAAGAWEDFEPESGNTITVPKEFPNTTKDTKYYVKAQIKTKDRLTVDKEAVTFVNVYSILPQDSVEIDLSAVTSVVPEDGVLLSANATPKQGDESGNSVEYQFYYRMHGSTKWTVINRAYVTSGQMNFTPKEEGVYYFKVEARTQGRTTVDAVHISYEPKTLYLDAPPIQAFTAVAALEKDYINGQKVRLNMDVDKGEAETVLYRVLYSTNARSYKEFKGVDYQVLPLEGGAAEVELPLLPEVKKDTIYYLKVELKTQGRTSKEADVFNSTQVEIKYATPIPEGGATFASIEADEVEFINDELGIGVPVTFSAQGNGTDNFDVQYTYSTNGRSFREIPDRSWENEGVAELRDETDILPLPSVRRDTHYYIRIEVRTAGHAKADVYDTCEVDVYMFAPLESIDSFGADVDSTFMDDGEEVGVKVLPGNSDILTLTAQANEQATYKFAYRLQGATKWTYISSRDITANQAFFRPRAEGRYEFKVEANAVNRKPKVCDVSLKLDYAVDIYFDRLPVETVELERDSAEDKDYIIGTDSVMNMDITVDGNENSIDYQVVYSNNNGKSYRPLQKWSRLTDTGDDTYNVSCNLPKASKDTRFLVKVETKTAGRTSKYPDVTSEPIEVWMISEERKISANLSYAAEKYEYVDDVLANIAISNPESYEIEYQLQYSEDQKRWYTFAAHDWKPYITVPAGSINILMDFTGLSGDKDVYIKLNARVNGESKIQDMCIEKLDLYEIMPVQSVDLQAVARGVNFVELRAIADDGGYNKDKLYRYSYAEAGAKNLSWIPFTSWISDDFTLFVPSKTANYLFKAEAKSKGRLEADAWDVALNNDKGYYLEFMEEQSIVDVVPEQEQVEEPEVQEPIDESSEDISSLDYANGIALGDIDINSMQKVEVANEEIIALLESEDAPIVIVQIGEESYGVLEGFEQNEEAAVLTVVTQYDTNTYSLQDIISAWYYEASIEQEKTAEEQVPEQQEIEEQEAEQQTDEQQDSEEQDSEEQDGEQAPEQEQAQDEQQAEQEEEAAETTVPKVVQLDGINFYTQKLKDGAVEGEYPIKVDGYSAGLAMMVESFRSEDVKPEHILAIEDIHVVGTESIKIKTGNVDYIIENRGIVEDYYGLKAHEIFKGFDIQQLRRRIKGFKYGDNSPVMVYFEIDGWNTDCSFVLDYKLDSDGLLDTDTYEYIPTYTAYRHNIDETGTFIYMQAMIAVDYERDGDGNVVSLTVLNPYSEFGQGAVVTEEGMTLTNDQVVPEIYLGELQGYMFFSQAEYKKIIEPSKEPEQNEETISESSIELDSVESIEQEQE